MNRYFVMTLAAVAAACSQQARNPANVVMPVGEIRTVQPALIDDSFGALGTVRSESMATLAAKVAGNVTSVQVHEGDRVRRGDILLTIDDRDIAAQRSKAFAAAVAVESSIAGSRAARESAAANARLATATYERYKVLRARNSVSPQEFDEVEGRYRTAIAESERAARAHEQASAQRQTSAADVAGANAMLSWTRIAAPFDGVVTARWVDPGAQATPGMPLLAIESTQRYRVDVSIDEEHAAAIQTGAAVRVSQRSGSAIGAGTVIHISPSADPATRTYRVQIALPAGDTPTSGASVTVRFPAGQRRAIAIPRTAIVDRGELHEVWTVESGDVVRMRYVTTGAVSGDDVEILSGLAAGDRIVVDAKQTLIDGVRAEGSQS